MNAGLALGVLGMFGFVGAFALVMTNLIDHGAYLGVSALAFLSYASSFFFVTLPDRPRATPPTR